MPKSNIGECQYIQTQLSPYFDNELQSWQSHIIGWHLKRCPKCSTRYASLKQTDSLLRYLEPVKASDDFLSNVMFKVKTVNTSQKIRRSFLNRLGHYVEGFQVWIRGNIRAYNPVYTVGFLLGVFMMIGVTLYSPRIENLNSFSQSISKSSESQHERLIVNEVILQLEPKRSVKIR